MIFDPDKAGERSRGRRATSAAAEQIDSAEQLRAREAQRQQCEREADPGYWRDRWLALYRSQGWPIARIAEMDGRRFDEVRAGIDQALRIYCGIDLQRFDAERNAARERAREALRRRATAEATP